MFAAGDLVVYGGEGVCRVERIGPSGMSYDDGDRLYYHLTPLYRSGTVLTPVDTGVLRRRWPSLRPFRPCRPASRSRPGSGPPGTSIIRW